MLYFPKKIDVIIRFTHLINNINRLSNFTGKDYLIKEEILMTELKEIYRMVEHDMDILFDEDKESIEIMNIILKENSNNFSIMMKDTNDFIENDFFLNFLVYINLFQYIKAFEYDGLPIVDINNDNLNSLLHSFKIHTRDSQLRFKYEEVIGSYGKICSPTSDIDDKPCVCYEHIEIDEGCFNNYYISNSSDYFINTFLNKFNLKEPA